MQLLREPDAFRRACDEARARGLRVGLVPTMGALHAGHAALIEEAARRAAGHDGAASGPKPRPPAEGFVVVSIFVNPTQFGPSEDFTRYPRTLEADMEKCERAGAAAVFAPADGAMYPPGDETRVRVGATAGPLCGAHRPGHFEGVTTVVAKLFALAGPCVAVFGRKDYQQLQVITRMTRDLFLPVELVGLRTVREPDGLALSSRNAYLSPAERADALAIPRGLAAASAAFARGERRAGVLAGLARESVSRVATSIDYVEVADPDSLHLHAEGDRAGDRALLALAIRIGKTRLIDNVVLGEDPAPVDDGGLTRRSGSEAGPALPPPKPPGVEGAP